jgi:hypothetical protein
MKSQEENLAGLRLAVPQSPLRRRDNFLDGYSVSALESVTIVRSTPVSLFGGQPRFPVVFWKKSLFMKKPKPLAVAVLGFVVAAG